jgi:hypothetical protein
MRHICESASSAAGAPTARACRKDAAKDLAVQTLEPALICAPWSRFRIIPFHTEDRPRRVLSSSLAVYRVEENTPKSVSYSDLGGDKQLGCLRAKSRHSMSADSSDREALVPTTDHPTVAVEQDMDSWCQAPTKQLRAQESCRCHSWAYA